MTAGFVFKDTACVQWHWPLDASQTLVLNNEGLESGTIAVYLFIFIYLFILLKIENIIIK